MCLLAGKEAQLCQKLGVKCKVLDRRSIENYLTQDAIITVKGEKYRELGHFEALSLLSPSWGKSENWIIARHMTRKDLDGNDLGKFLEKL